MKIALFTQNEKLAQEILALTARYVEEKTLECETKVFGAGDETLCGQGGFEAALIEATDDGIAVAARMRESGFHLPIVFVAQTNYFSVEGKKIDAMGFLTCPVSYYAFATMLDRIQTRLVSMETHTVALMTKQGVRRLSTDNITYIENSGINVVYHTTEGDIRIHGSMNDAAKKVTADRFFRLGNYLLNLGHVYRVSGMDVYVGDACLPLPLNKKAELISSLLAFMNRG